MLCKDIELACDEKLEKDMTFLEKKEYPEVLFSYTHQRCMVMVCPLVFGEVGDKGKSEINIEVQKMQLWIILATIAVCVLEVCFLTNLLNKVDVGTVFSKGYIWREPTVRNQFYTGEPALGTAGG